MENKITLLKDIAYGAHERQKVDLFIPEKIKSDSGLILFIHGGGWVQGDKSAHHADAQHFSGLGYVSATMNYRYVSENLNVFDELDDITSAIATVKVKCNEYGLCVKKLILSGGSAGAHLSLLYSYTRKHEASLTPVAVCAYCPPVNCAKTDFLMGISGDFEDWKYEVLSNCCGCKVTKADFSNTQQQKALLRISPVEYISADIIPTAVFHGRKDELVPIEHTYDFIKLLGEKGIKNDLLIYENSGHTLEEDPEAALKAKEIIKTYAEMYF